MGMPVGRRARAFTLVELLMVIGIVVMLMSLALPQMGAAREQARLTRRLAQIRQNAALIDLYCAQAQDVYPLHEESAWWSKRRWYRCLMNAGLIEGYDPLKEASGPASNLFNLSLAMVYDPAYMRRGHTRQATQETLDKLPSDPVRRHDVLFPSSKGLLYQEIRNLDLHQIEYNFWCCVREAPLGPVAFADASAALGKWWDFLPDGPLDTENWIGFPVLSTWNGCQGRDR